MIETETKAVYTPQDKEVTAARFGNWHVYQNGSIEHLTRGYFIAGSRLDQKDWIAHLFEKAWIDWNEFIPAYMQGLKNRGIQEVNILVFYP